MPLSVSFLFHFNQSWSNYAKVADLSCYRGLVNVLRRHKNLRFTIHLSGTLLESMRCMKSETLRAIQRGVGDGQFEIMGSTYAQNVMAATDDYSNRMQMEQHLETIRNVFGVRPKGFWVPERCWKQEFVKTLSDFGYEYTLVEQQTLAKSGSRRLHLPHTTAFKSDKLDVVNDDEPFKHKVNLSVWASDRVSYFDAPMEHLLSVERRYPDQRAIVVYAEDAEASGLWGYHHGICPQPIWRNWDHLLDRLSEGSRHCATSIGAFLDRTRRRETVKRIPDGQAVWMVASLNRKGAPYHEDGYKNWFDFCRRAPKLKKFRPIFRRIARAIIAARAKTSPATAARAIIARIQRSFCASQFEFGCIGIGKSHGSHFNNALRCEKDVIALQKRSSGMISKRAGKWIEPRSGWIADEFAGNGSRPIRGHGSWRKYRRDTRKDGVWFKRYISQDEFDKVRERVTEYRREVPVLRCSAIEPLP